MRPRPGGRLGTFPKPVRAVRSLLRAAALVAVLGFVAHNGGAGWVQALADLVVGAVAVGLLAPGLLLGRAVLVATASPPDATAGMPVEIGLRCSARLRVVPLDPPGPEVFVGPSRGPRAPRGDTCVVLARRGVYGSAVLEVATAAPFGMLWWKRQVTVALPGELCVAPRLGPAVPAPSAEGGDPGTTRRTASASGGVHGGVRPYRAGDPRHRVHWPASAHAAELMVRVVDAEEDEQVVVEVSLPSDADLADELAERALGTVVALQDRGSPVLLVTNEAAGERRGPVADRRSAGRRLARALSRTGSEVGLTLRREGSRGRSG